MKSELPNLAPRLSLEADIAGGFPKALLRDVTDETIAQWTSHENLAACTQRNVAGFVVFYSIDGNTVPGREVSLVQILQPGIYAQHIHKESDAVFIILAGTAIFCSGHKRVRVTRQSVIEVPRMMPHGFDLAAGEMLLWISIQSPPIRDHVSGEEDLYPMDLTQLV